MFCLNNPKILIIRLLEACNAGCFMCDFAFSKNGYRFSLADLINLTKQPQFSNIRLVRFTGGEPLLMPDFPAHVSHLRGRDVLSSVITNGWHLRDCVQKLVSAGLDQIVVSIDGPDSSSHDKFRNLSGLFDRIVDGIEALKAAPRGPQIRVNTVVGRHNIGRLPELWDLMNRLGIDQWSLIPLKRQDGAWGTMSLEQMRKGVSRFGIHVKNSKLVDRAFVPKILGYGLDLFGRNDVEVSRLWQENRNIVPLGDCRLVDQVRYYVPKEGVVFPCNCVPHRSDADQNYEEFSPVSISDLGLTCVRDRLRTQGHVTCRGCEPVNAALADGLIDLDDDPLGF